RRPRDRCWANSPSTTSPSSTSTSRRSRSRSPSAAPDSSTTCLSPTRRSPVSTRRPAPRSPDMSTDAALKLTLTALADVTRRGDRLTSVTAYDYPSARLADAAGVDIVLVGDSAAMAMLGYDSTLPISVDEMLTFTRAAVRGVRRAIVVADMPFGSFQVSDEM